MSRLISGLTINSINYRNTANCVSPYSIISMLEDAPVCLTNKVRPFFISLMVSKAVMFHILATLNYFMIIKHILIVIEFGAISRAACCSLLHWDLLNRF